MPHIHPKIDFTVGALIVYNNKVFLRKHDKYNLWMGIGGHIELDEDPVQAVIREAKEEAGLDIEIIGTLPDIVPTQDQRELIVPHFMDRHRISPDHEHISMTYFARAKTDQVAPTGDDISNEWRWVSAEELATMDLLPKIRYYANEALRVASES